MVGVKITTGEVVKASQVCSVGGMAQFVDASNGDETAETVGYAGQRVVGTPKMFYLNGDDIEQLLDYSPSAFEHALDLVSLCRRMCDSLLMWHDLYLDIGKQSMHYYICARC